MENIAPTPSNGNINPEVSMTTPDSISSKPPKGNNSLLYLLSLTTILASVIAAFFFWQNQRIVKEYQKLSNNTKITTPTPSPLMSPTPIEEDTEIRTGSASLKAGWTKTYHPGLELNFCLPPKWEFSRTSKGDISSILVYKRDAQYETTITTITPLALIEKGENKLIDSYSKYWELEYPNVTSLVSFEEVTLGKNTIIKVTPKNKVEPKEAPDGSLAIVWNSKSKLFKAGFGNWQMVNNSQTAFLKDIYSMIECTF